MYIIISPKNEELLHSVQLAVDLPCKCVMQYWYSVVEDFSERTRIGWFYGASGNAVRNYLIVGYFYFTKETWL